MRCNWDDGIVWEYKHFKYQVQYHFDVIEMSGTNPSDTGRQTDAPSGDGRVRAGRLAVLVGAESTGPEIKAADILKSRIFKRSSVTATTATEGSSEVEDAIRGADLVLVVGSPEGNGLSRRLMDEFEAKLPTLPNTDRKHPEGFTVKSGKINGKPHAVIAGADERGTMYGVGWVLRAIAYHTQSIDVPVMDVEEKPAFWMRGGNPSGPGSRARRYGKLRPQTPEERREVMEDLILLGTNIFGGDPGLTRSYGMMTTSGRTANEMPRNADGTRGFPKEWAADGGISEKCVCPSVPEARKALLGSFDRMFREDPKYDFFTTNSGDTGGCRCEKCMPWGATYIRLLHEIAEILHRYHPNRRILATNQDLSNEGNQAIFEYLNSRDSSWLYAIRYGPGADEMQTYIRGAVNPGWFKYEGFGPLGNYLKYMHHELPRTTNIALYTDITHWMQSQFGVPKPDVALAAVYGRRSWNARPKHFHRVGREIMHYVIGDMHYSEGMHDDFNKWFWYRMLWDPHQSAEEITKEYCRYWFGPEAQDDVARAIFLMEDTLEKRVMDNPGIAKAVELLHSAGSKIPENLLACDYRWRVIMQKALMDLYIQLELRRGEELKGEAGQLLESVSTSGNLGGELKKALQVLGQPLETPKMKEVREEALRLGEESNRIIGYRVPAPFILERLDIAEVGWWKKMLSEAVSSEDDSRIRNVARMLLHYEDPGQGGFYDNPGWPNESEHLVYGEALWGFMPFPGPARLSHYSLVYSWGRDGRGVAFSYSGLDPDVQYVVRISAGVNLEGQELPVKGVELVEGLEVNGHTISEGFPVTLGGVGFHEFDLPRDITRGGELEISLVPKSKLMPVTGLCEIWLMRKENMPWTVR